MTPQEKKAKIVDLQKQLRKIRRVEKFLITKPYFDKKRGRIGRYLNRIKRIRYLKSKCHELKFSLMWLQG